MTVSLAQGGEGVGAMWGEQKTRDYLTRAGFRSVTTHRLAHDVQNNWYVVTNKRTWRRFAFRSSDRRSNRAPVSDAES